MQHHQGSPLTAAQAKIWGSSAFQDYILTVTTEQQQRPTGLSPHYPQSDELASIAADPVTRGILLKHRCRLKFLDGDTGDLGRRYGDGAKQKSTALSSFSVCHRRVRVSGPDHAAIRRCCTLLAARFPAFANRTPAATGTAAAAHNSGCGPAAAAAGAATGVRNVRAGAGRRGHRCCPSQQLPQWDELRRKCNPGHRCEGAGSSATTGRCSSFLVPSQLELEGFTWDKDCRFYKPVADTAANLAANSTATKTQQCRQPRHNYWGIGEDNYSAFFTASHDSNLHDMLHSGNSLTGREDALSAKSSVTCASFTFLLSGDSSKVGGSKAEKCRRDTDTSRCDRTNMYSGRKMCHRHKMTRDISIQTVAGLRHMWPCSGDHLHAAAEPAVTKSSESDTVTMFTLMSGQITRADAATMCSGRAIYETQSYQDNIYRQLDGRSTAEKCKRGASDSNRSHRRKTTMDISIQTVSGLHQNRSCSDYLHVAPPAPVKPAEPGMVGKFTLTPGKATCEDAALTMCLRRNKQEAMFDEATVQPTAATNAKSVTSRKSGFRGKLVHKKITWFIRTAPLRGRTRPILARI